MYLLDTSICIYLMKKKHPGLQAKVEQEKLFNLALSSITIAELEFGVAKSLYPQQNRELLYGFLSPFEIIPFSELDAENFGSIRAYLQKRGTPIGPYDFQIAAQCVSRDLCLVTNNTKEFERVPKLRIEDWTQEQNDT